MTEKEASTGEAVDNFTFTESDVSPDSSKWRRRRNRTLKYLGAGAIGAVAALGPNNVYGNHTSVGDVRLETHATLGKSQASLTSDFLDLRKDLGSWIPIGVTADVKGTSLDLSSPDELVKAAGVVNDPQATAERLTHDYARQAEIMMGIGALAGVGALYGIEWLSKDKRKRRIANSVVALVAAGIASTGGLPTHEVNKVPWKHANFSIGGHPIDVDYSGAAAGKVVEEAKSNEAYANDIRDNVKAALIPIAAEDDLFRPDADRLTVYSDWHCNYPMARSIRQVNDSLGVKQTLNVGDNFLGQTPIEVLCADVLGTNLKSTENFVAPGNHDADFLLKRMKENGFKILDNKMAKIAGVNVLGTEDAMLSPAYSHKDHERTPGVTSEDFTQTVTDLACKYHPDILANHEPQETSDRAMACAKLTINGHTHELRYPRKVGPDNYVINDGTSGGAAPNRQSVYDRLGKDATMYILYTQNGEVIGSRVITVHPDKSVEVSQYMSLVNDASIDTTTKPSFVGHATATLGSQ